MNEIGQRDTDNITSKIYTIRGLQVMLDRNLSELYGVENKKLNEQVKRNIDRFPQKFRFQLTKNEKDELVAICDHLQSMKYSSSLPYVFTEQGVAMLSSVLNSKIAIEISIKIIDAFVNMRKFISNNGLVFQRLDSLEHKQLQTDEKIEAIFHAIEAKSIKPTQGIFYDGQIYDAYVFVADLIKSAKENIILIDNYIDETVLTLFSKNPNIKVVIYTNSISKQLKLDLQKYNAQYKNIELKEFKNAHDRFMILDNKEVYHIGASLKYLGKKWFAFSKFDVEVFEMLSKLDAKLYNVSHINKNSVI